MDKEFLEQCEAEVSKTLMQLMRQSHNSFIVNVLLNIDKQFTSEVEAMELHGDKIKINPQFFMEQSKEERKYDLLREAWHIPFFDELRGQTKEDKEVWSAAANHYNNLMLKADTQNTKVEVPDWATCDSRFKGKEKDDIYQILYQEKQQQQSSSNGSGGGNGSSGANPNDPLANDIGHDGSGDPQQGDGNQSGKGQTPQSGMTQEQMEQMQRKLENIVQQSAMQAKMAGGHVPSSVEEYLDDLYNPKLRWEQLLAKYMTSYSSDDYSYQKINKSLFPHGIIMPTLFSEGLGKIAIANDESCSVSDEEFKTYLGAIQDIKTRMNPEQIDVVAFTTQITKVWQVEQDDDISKIKFRGNGGTHIPVVFDHFNRPENRPQVLIIFSDMESALPTQKPPYDVIWISVNNSRFKAPFGRSIYVNV